MTEETREKQDTIDNISITEDHAIIQEEITYETVIENLDCQEHSGDMANGDFEGEISESDGSEVNETVEADEPVEKSKPVEVDEFYETSYSEDIKRTNETVIQNTMDLIKAELQPCIDFLGYMLDTLDYSVPLDSFVASRFKSFTDKYKNERIQKLRSTSCQPCRI